MSLGMIWGCACLNAIEARSFPWHGQEKPWQFVRHGPHAGLPAHLLLACQPTPPAHSPACGLTHLCSSACMFCHVQGLCPWAPSNCIAPRSSSRARQISSFPHTHSTTATRASCCAYPVGNHVFVSICVCTMLLLHCTWHSISVDQNWVSTVQPAAVAQSKLGLRPGCLPEGTNVSGQCVLI